MADELTVGFDPASQMTLERYLATIAGEDLNAISSGATNLLSRADDRISDLVKDLGGERVLAHTFAAVFLACLDKLGEIKR